MSIGATHSKGAAGVRTAAFVQFRNGLIFWIRFWESSVITRIEC